MKLPRSPTMKPQVFKTRRYVEHYFSGDTIECLICGRHFKRLHRHLGAKHNLSADHYKKQFGLAWTRGLTSATSLAKSGWTEERKAVSGLGALEDAAGINADLTPTAPCHGIGNHLPLPAFALLKRNVES